MREFTDAKGVRWVVWSTMPMTGGVAGSLKGGWLTFESPEGRRRLAPIPDGWEDASPRELGRFCEQAAPLGRTPHTGSWRIEPRD